MKNIGKVIAANAGRITANAPSTHSTPLRSNLDNIPTSPRRPDSASGARYFGMFGGLGFGKKSPALSKAKIGKFVSLTYAQDILDKADPSQLQPRDPNNPPSVEGLLAAIGYTSNHKLAKEINDALDNPNASGNKRIGDLQQLGALIKDTASKLKPVEVDIAYRNTTLSLDEVKKFYPLGQPVTSKRLDSVTLNPDGPFYKGGNINIIYHLKKENGVAGMRPLSQFGKENEGFIYTENRNLVAESYEERKPDATVEHDANTHPAITIHIKEV